jgi:hypothetical protein
MNNLKTFEGYRETMERFWKRFETPPKKDDALALSILEFIKKSDNLKLYYNYGNFVVVFSDGEHNEIDPLGEDEWGENFTLYVYNEDEGPYTENQPFRLKIDDDFLVTKTSVARSVYMGLKDYMERKRQQKLDKFQGFLKKIE